jgi:hypothetical protein
LDKKGMEMTLLKAKIIPKKQIKIVNVFLEIVISLVATTEVQTVSVQVNKEHQE